MNNKEKSNFYLKNLSDFWVFYLKVSGDWTNSTQFASIEAGKS